MAKLTRTQKFANLRESLANDKESSLSTKDLSNYENRLNSITSRGEDRYEGKQVRIPEEDPRYIWTAFEDTPETPAYVPEELHVNDSYVWNNLQEMPETGKQGAVTDFVMDNPFEEFDKILSEKAPEEPVKEVPIQETHVEMPKAEEIRKVEPVIETPVQQPVAPACAEEEEEEPLDADAVEPQKPAEEEQYMGLYKINPEVEAAYAEAEKHVIEETPETDKPIFTEEHVPNPIADIPTSELFIETPADNHEADHSQDNASNLMNDTLNEVNAYNTKNGEQTINALTGTMINQIRHGDENPQQKFEEVPLNEKEDSDDEFSNTVTTEISNIINSISDAEDIKEEVKPEPVREEHPVLAKALEEEEQEDVVEIRNINELENSPANTISNTIPFVVTPTDDEEIIDDDMEEDSNTILNIILVILIVILVAVLGLIIFYILKTKGII